MKTFYRWLTCAVVAAFLPSLSGTAQAAKTVLHGSACQWDHVKHSIEPGERGVHYWSAGIENTLRWRFAEVDCPLPRLGGGSGSIFDLEVRVTTDDTRLFCILYALDRFGDASTETPRLYVSGTGSRTLDFGNPGLAPPYEGSYYLKCGLPPGSWVHSITVDQTL